jgi:hypothetical protein
VSGHGVRAITRNCKVLPMGAFVEGKLHFVINAIAS